MQYSLAIILGLTAALCWGGADFTARFASRRVGAFRTLFYMQFFGFLVLSAYLKFRGGFFDGIAPGWHPWALAVLAGVLNMVASLSLYYSFEIGVMSIVAPVSSAYPALTVTLAIMSGERITPLRGGGLAVTLLGVILAATSFAPVKAASREGNRASRERRRLGDPRRSRLRHAFLVSRILCDPGSGPHDFGMGDPPHVILGARASRRAGATKPPASQRQRLVAARRRRLPRYRRVHRQ